jgi:hypothetical protein
LCLEHSERNDTYYEKEEMKLIENGAIGKALWIDKDDFLTGDRILYPIEIKKKL